MAERGRERSLRGSLVTAAAGLLLLGSLVVIGVALAADGGTPAPGAPAPSATPDASRAAYVGKANCDDARAPDAVRDAASPWCTLERAVKAMPDGGTVRVAAGRYPRLRVEDRAAASNPLVLEPQEGRDRPELEGMSLDRVNGLRVEGMRFISGAAVERSTEVELVGNEFVAAGIYVKASRNLVIRQNRIHDLQGVTRGILLQGSNSMNDQILVEGNRLERIDHDAIAVFNGNRHITIRDNRITSVRQPANFRYHSDALQMMGGEQARVEGNVVNGVTHGMLFKDGKPASGLIITGNLITRSSGAGLEVFNAPGAQVRANTVYGTKFGLRTANRTSKAGISLRENILDQLFVLGGNAIRRADRNVFARGRPVGRRAYRGRPRFVDAKSGDLRVRSATQGAGVPPGRAIGAQLRLR